MRRHLRRAATGLGVALCVSAMVLVLAPAAWAGDFGGQTTAGGAPQGPPGSTPGCAKTSDPIDVYTGRWTYEHADLVVPGILPIVMVRTYDSQMGYDSPLGHGWAFTYDLRVTEYQDQSVVVRSGCGRRDRYVFSGGAYVTPVGVRATLTPGGSGQYTLTYPGGSKAFFDVEGKLQALQDPQGNRLEMSYDTRGKLPLTGTSPFAIDPSTPLTVAQVFRLTKIEERAAGGTLTGRQVTLAYTETTGRLTSISSQDGRTVTYVQDVHAGTGLTTGNLVQVNGLEGIVQTFAYNDVDPGTGLPRDRHDVTTFTDGTGTTPWVNLYDPQDRVTRQTHANTQIDLSYGTPFRTTVTRTVKDAQGLNPYTAVTVYDFDTDGYPLKVTDALKHELRQARSAAKYVTREELWRNTGTIAVPVLALEKATDFTYDLSGNRLTETTTLDSSEVVTETWTYDHDWVASHQVVSSLAPSKLFREEMTFFRDGASNPTNVQELKRRKDDGSFETTTLAYNAQGRLASVTLPDGGKIVNTYFTLADASIAQRGMLQKTAQEISGSEDPHLKLTYTYDARGNVASVTDARNNVTAILSDNLGRVTKLTNALSEETRYTYTGPNPAYPGKLLTQVEVGWTAALGEGQVTKLVYNAEERLTQIQRKDDTATFVTFATFSYDSDGNRLSATDGEGRTTLFAYDLLGRAATTTDAEAHTTGFGYDAAGHRTSVTDAYSRVTSFTYDDLGRLAQTQSASISPTQTTSFAYDAAGNLTQLTDAESHTTVYAYDALSRLTSVTQPLAQQVQYAYDGRGRLDQVVNARGHKLDYVYYTWGPLQKVDHYLTTSSGTPTRTVSYAYDNTGNLTSTTDDSIQAGALYTATYDALNRLDVLTAQYLPGSNRTLDSDYDRYGNRKQLGFVDGAQTFTHAYTFNKLDQLGSAS